MYFTRLSSFKSFISSAFNLQIDDLIRRIKEGNEDVFEFLNEYSSYLSNTNISSITIKQRVVTVKNFFQTGHAARNHHHAARNHLVRDSIFLQFSRSA